MQNLSKLYFPTEYPNILERINNINVRTELTIGSSLMCFRVYSTKLSYAEFDNWDSIMYYDIPYKYEYDENTIENDVKRMLNGILFRLNYLKFNK